MNFISCTACISLICGAALGGEPKGGLADKALVASDFEGHWTRRIPYLFDPKASPPEIFQVVTNSSRRPTLSTEEVQKSIARQNEEHRDFAVRNLSSLGAEAQIILDYYDTQRSKRFSLQIYRYKTPEGLEDMWRRRGTSPEFNSTRTAGEDVIFTKAGQVFPGGVKASQPSMEAREGVYHVMVSPGQPKLDDPGLLLLKKQLEKLRIHAEPDTARNAAAANGSTNTSLTSAKREKASAVHE